MRRPTSVQEVVGLILGSGHIAFVEIWSCILFLPLIQVGPDERMGPKLVLVNRLGSLPRNIVDRLTDRLDMTFLSWLGRKTQIQTKTKSDHTGQLLIIFLAGRSNHLVDFVMF